MQVPLCSVLTGKLVWQSETSSLGKVLILDLNLLTPLAYLLIYLSFYVMRHTGFLHQLSVISQESKMAHFWRKAFSNSTYIQPWQQAWGKCLKKTEQRRTSIFFFETRFSPEKQPLRGWEGWRREPGARGFCNGRDWGSLPKISLWLESQIVELAGTKHVRSKDMDCA